MAHWLAVAMRLRLARRGCRLSFGKLYGGILGADVLELLGARIDYQEKVLVISPRND